MTEHTYLRQDEVVRRAVEALVRELGPVEAMRFLSMGQTRIYDSVGRHRQWQENLDIDRFFDQVFEVASE
jgi:hypothetical protein